METKPLNPTSGNSSISKIRNWLPEASLALGIAVMTIIVGRMIYHDSFVNGSTYSNRSFTLPAAGFSIILVAYGYIRLSKIPIWLRLIGAPFIFFVGYLSIGLLLILINAAI